MAIGFYVILHGFRGGQGTETTSLESKILKHMMVMKEAVLYDVFLELHNVYNTLDMDRCLDILSGYGASPREILILWRYWRLLNMVENSGGYHVPP